MSFGRGYTGRPRGEVSRGRPVAKKLTPAQRVALDRIDNDVKRLRAARRPKR